MTGFADNQLELGAGADLETAETVDVELVNVAATQLVDEPAATAPLEQCNLYAAAERRAQRAATPATRRQYSAIYRSFADWLRGELGRPPVVADLDADAIAAYARHLEQAGGRGGRPAAPATRRVYLSMLRALARELDRPDVGEVKVPRHQAGPPETMTETDYANLLRVPDRRSQIGKRDYALLRVLGDCGLRDDEAMFVRLGRHAGVEAPAALSAQSVHKLVRRCAVTAGVPERLAHPHALRAYWATSLLDAGVAIHRVSARLGHADLRTTSRYAGESRDDIDDVADVLDRRHQAARRQRTS